MELTRELLPCPFCGDIPASNESYAWCHGNDKNKHPFIQLPLASWNSRPSSTPESVGHAEGEMRKNAKRYEWLRADRKSPKDGKPFIAIAHQGGAGFSAWTDVDADAAIDTAMSASEKG